MKLYFHLIALQFLFCISASAQLDAEMLKIPKEHQASTEKLSAFLTQGITDDSIKAARIYKWVTNNIAYDYAVLESSKPLKYQTAANVLKTKKAVCQGYCVLLIDLYKKAGISAAPVEGYTSGVLSDSLVLACDSDHEWVSFKVKGRWYLCDPTWDAGYIGRIPKLKDDPVKKEKLAEKRKKQEAAADEKKKKKLKYKWEKADKKTEAKEEKLRGEYKDKVGFVFYPDMEYFMQNPTDFVQSHLPSIPAFQLRDYPITMEDFYKKTKTWDTILSRKEGKPLDYSAFAETFAHEKTHKQWIITAVEGLEFNPLSYGCMALNHFNYESVHLSEDVRKMYDDIKKSDLDESMTDLRTINDSVLVYCKEAQYNNKVAFADTKRIQSKESKIYTTTDKAAFSTIGKIIAAQDKNLEVLKSKEDVLQKNLVTVETKKAKILADSPTAATPIDLDESFVPEIFEGLQDSLYTILTQIDDLRTSWDSLVHGSDILDQRFETLEDAYQLSFFNLQILNSAPLYFDDTVVHYDTLMSRDFDWLLDFHKETYKQLLYPDEIMKLYKTFDTQLKNGLTRMKNYSQRNISFKYLDAFRYWNSIHFQLLSTISEELYQTNDDRQQLYYIEKDLKQYYEILKKNLEKEKEFKADNIEHCKEQLEIENKRTIELFKSLKENAEKASEFYDKTLGK